MKKIFLIAIILTNSLFLHAQYIKDKWGDIIPFSLTEKYKNVIKTNEIHSLILKPLNNDSLFFEKNNFNSYKEVGSTYCYGITIDSLIDFKKYAEKIIIDEGTLWIMTVESPTAASIGIKISDFDLPDKTYFTIYPGTIPNVIQEPEVGFKQDINEHMKKNGLSETIYDEKAVLEFFVLKGINSKPNFIIDKIVYGFAGLGKPGTKPNYKEIKEEYENSSNDNK